MLAYIAIAALFAAGPVQEQFEDFEDQEEMLFYEEDSEEIAINEDLEYDEFIFFEEQCDIADDLLYDEE